MRYASATELYANTTVSHGGDKYSETTDLDRKKATGKYVLRVVKWMHANGGATLATTTNRVMQNRARCGKGEHRTSAEGRGAGMVQVLNDGKQGEKYNSEDRLSV